MQARLPTREVRSWTTDSRRWAHYVPRADDIVIATAPKCGTTWMQQIVSLLVFRSPAPKELQFTSPWIDFRLPPIEQVLAAIEAQSHRRFLKSHLPCDALPIYDTVKYIHVARDGRDAFMSWHNHAGNYSDFSVQTQSAAGMADETIARPLPRPAASPHEYFATWMKEGPENLLVDDSPATRFFDMEKSWWKARRQPNVLMVHYNDLKTDLEGEMRRIARFLGIEIGEDAWPALVKAAGFDFMRENGATLMPRAVLSWDKGHERFLNKGTNGRWQEALTRDDVARYESRVAREFSPALAAWVAKGRLAAGDPRVAAD
ncbi:MAG TPA: sulfotransferase domain-containing protein [Rhizomicrobium sp.]|nr:sulfotransferase domain-containing protein [Rhizomicrobium sp.]